MVMSYSKNGEDLGMCFEVEKEKLEDKALFPHILTKNTEFECNFGAKVQSSLNCGKITRHTKVVFEQSVHVFQ